MAWTAALLLLPLLSLRWVLFLGAQAVQTPQDPTLLDRVLSASDIARPLLYLTCMALSGLSKGYVRQLAMVLRQRNATAVPGQPRGPPPGGLASSLATVLHARLLTPGPSPPSTAALTHRRTELGVPKDVDTFLDLLHVLDLALCPLSRGNMGAGCGGWQSPATSVCSSTMGPGPQACASFLSRLAQANMDVLLSTAAKRQRLLSVALACRGVLGTRLHPAFLGPDWKQAQLTMVHPRLRRDTQKAACPPGRKPAVVDENLFFYADWELEVCVDGRLLAAQMDRVNSIPFTYQQLDILKRRLDEGYPESLTRRLGHFFLAMSLEDIHKWNVTSVDTVTALLRASRGRRLDAQVAALIFRYMMGRNWLDQEVLDALAGFRPLYLCVLSPEQLVHLPPSAVESVGPQDLDTCSPQQLAVLYPKALLAFRNASGPGYTEKIQSFLGGASTDDLRALIWRNVSVDMATFRKLRVEALVPLTVAEVQSLLGPHVVDLKSEADRSPVRDWICRQLQEDLDTLQLGLLGGVPSGYLLLDLTLQETHSRAPRLCPGQLLAAMVPLLLTLPSR